MNFTTDKYISGMTVSELKNLIKECLRELEEEKQQFTEEQYKQLWIKPPTTTDGLKCKHPNYVTHDGDPCKGK